MSSNDPSFPITPSTPHTPSFPSIPSLLNRNASTRTTKSIRRCNSSTVEQLSIPSSPLETTLHQPWPIRGAVRATSDTEMTCPSPILDCVPITAFTTTKTSPITHPIPPPSKPQYIELPYSQSLAHIRSPLLPLISVTTGQPHPSFPTTLLQYHLLTHPQLDRLSRHYHQTEPPTAESFRYPTRVPGWLAPMTAAQSTNDEEEQKKKPAVSLEMKRRRFGRFIGLRGCESPMSPMSPMTPVEERMEREWRRNLERKREEERVKEKIYGRW